MDGSSMMPAMPTSETDFVIMNVYSKMKNLENKYIDLANFYKESLVREQETKTVLVEHVNTARTPGSDRLNEMNVGSSPNLLVQQAIDQSKQDSIKQSDTFTENLMIRNLIDEKHDLEENMKTLKQVVEQREIQT